MWHNALVDILVPQFMDLEGIKLIPNVKVIRYYLSLIECIEFCEECVDSALPNRCTSCPKG